MQNDPRIRILVFKDGDMFVAQCLEYDIAASAETLKDLRNDIIGTIECYRQESEARSGAAFQGLDPAPAEFHEMWGDADSQQVSTWKVYRVVSVAEFERDRSA